MGRRVIEDDMNLLMRRAQRDDFFKRGDEVAAGIGCGGFAVNTAGCGVQRGIQGRAFRAGSIQNHGARRVMRERGNTGSRRSSARNGSFLIEAEHSRMLRSIQIQPDNVCGFGFDLRIIAGHVAFPAMRLQTSLFPYAMGSVLADAQCRGELPATLVGRANLRPFPVA
jgi:hypothetical protein